MAPKYIMSSAQYRGEGRESDWRKTVKDMAAAYGWVVLFELPDKAYATLAQAASTYDKTTKKRVYNKRSMIPVMLAIKSQPDLLLGHPERGVAIVVELKIPGKKPRDDQGQKLDLYASCGVSSFVWETGDDEAERVLGQYGLGSWT